MRQLQRGRIQLTAPTPAGPRTCSHDWSRRWPKRLIRAGCPDSSAPGFATTAAGEDSADRPDASRPEDLLARLVEEMAEAPDPSGMSRFEAFRARCAHLTDLPLPLITEGTDLSQESGEEGSVVESEQLSSPSYCSVSALSDSNTVVLATDRSKSLQASRRWAKW